MSKKELPSLLDELTTVDQLHSLLKIYKDNNKDVVRLSGNKSDLINNLLECMRLSIISFEKIYELIQDAEEFGNQYIYLYETVHSHFNHIYNDGTSVQSNILKNQSQKDFPKITLIPSKFEWVDFRVPNRGVENSWLGKIYDKKEREVLKNETITAGERTVVYKIESTRVIYVVHWNGKGGLEYRISRTSYDSAKSLNDCLNKIRKKTKDGIEVYKHFRKVNLTKTINNFLLSYESSKNIYGLLSTQLKDSQNGTATIKIFDQDNGDLFSELSRRNAIDAYMKNHGNGTGIVVRFFAKGSEGNLERDINVILGRDDINQIIIQAKVTPQEYRYVRRKITEFSR